MGRRAIVVGALGALATFVVGCTSSGGPVAGPPEAPSVHATAAPCTASELRPSARATAASRGEVAVTVTLANRGPRPCAITRLPTVRVFDTIFAPLHRPVPNGDAMAGGVRLVTTLAPGQSAYLRLTWEGTAPGTNCHRNHVDALDHLTVELRPHARALRIAAADLPRSARGLCWADVVEIVGAGVLRAR